MEYIISSENTTPNNMEFLEILDSNVKDVSIFNLFEDYYLKKYKANENTFDYIWIIQLNINFC